MPNVSVTLFEGIVLLILTGAGSVAWWGIRRIVKISDDGAAFLNNINKSLALICERLSKSEMWMELHEKSDDERHTELKGSYQVLSNLLIDRKKGA
jgi:hypothetical protein